MGSLRFWNRSSVFMYGNSKYLLPFLERKRCFHSDLRAQLLNAASKGRKMKSRTEKEREPLASIKRERTDGKEVCLFALSLIWQIKQQQPVPPHYALILRQLNIIRASGNQIADSHGPVLYTKFICRSPFPLLSTLVSYPISLSVDDVQ